MLKRELITIHDHPYGSKKQNRMLEYRLRAEKVLGKYLNPKHPVHHHNDELVICENRTYHKLLHQRTDALKECGHANWRKCCRCKKYDDLKNLTITKGDTVYHNKCAAKYSRQLRRRNRHA